MPFLWCYNLYPFRIQLQSFFSSISFHPQHKDNVSKVISIFLKRTPASQI